jgi:hypothetical protein
MVVTRYQFRLSTYLLTVVIGALIAASPRLISWAVGDVLSLRPSLVTEYHSLSSQSDLACEASPSRVN